jgi:type IV secretory pathway TrbF-like protein
MSSQSCLATVVEARGWHLGSLVLSSVLGASLLANIHLGRQHAAVPHIIEIDARGKPTYRGPAEEGASAFTPSEAVVRAQLRRFIALTRTISSDTVLLTRNLNDVWKLLTVKAQPFMKQWIEDAKPFQRAQKETTAVEILSAVPVSAESWQIDWKETAWDKSGQAIGKPVIWRAMLKIVIEQPTTPELMIDNPVGLFVDEFHWDRIQQVKP